MPAKMHKGRGALSRCEGRFSTRPVEYSDEEAASRSSIRPETVVRAMQEALEGGFGNPSSRHRLGIAAREADRRHSSNYVMANITPDVFMEHGCSRRPDALPQKSLWKIKEPTWH